MIVSDNFYDIEFAKIITNSELFFFLLQLKRSKREVSTSHTSLSSDKRIVLISPDKKTATVFGLQPNSLNYAQIAVMNGQNDGTPSDPISFRTKEGGRFTTLQRVFISST